MKELRKILHVEDEPDIQAIARLALAVVGGMEVLTCSSGGEAVAKAERFDPDLIILDVMMPGMDGPETLAALREIPSLADKPVMFMTAKVQPHEIRYYFELGALDVIAKPFDPITLPARVQEIWRSSQGTPGQI